MNRFFFLSLLLLPLTTLIAELDVDVEARFAFFRPENSKLQNVYGNWWDEYEVEASTPLNCDWYLFANGNYYNKNGHLSDKRHREEEQRRKHSTRINLTTLNFGVKHYISFCFLEYFENSLRPYIGAGAGPAYVNFHRHSSERKKNNSQWGLSLLGKVGMELELTHCFFLDFFSDYGYQWFFQKKGIHHHRLDTGGFKFGLGLGYHF